MTPEEDAELRRLNYFASIGAELAIPRQLQKQELRARDRRLEIRPPADELSLERDALA
jgi:hypothetical protein